MELKNSKVKASNKVNAGNTKDGLRVSISHPLNLAFFNNNVIMLPLTSALSRITDAMIYAG
jgi:hypothetical protein